MEFKDRVARYPGRIALKKVSTNVATGQEIYDVTLADVATEPGTPINKQTMDAFRKDIIDSVQGQGTQIDQQTLDALKTEILGEVQNKLDLYSSKVC